MCIVTSKQLHRLPSGARQIIKYSNTMYKILLFRHCSCSTERSHINASKQHKWDWKTYCCICMTSCSVHLKPTGQLLCNDTYVWTISKWCTETEKFHKSLAFWPGPATGPALVHRSLQLCDLQLAARQLPLSPHWHPHLTVMLHTGINI